ncbi:acetyl-CoA carboxylase biotin carboxyl carrier protein [Aquisalinus flavus]|nr:acetyl-CoA carboxylase biotin carboxyl carrier protein [Aquisalinus flavus]MBD0427516.1 acetyl-CoA carboxylase biotin carboxyl carrier protein [Aquisalinus flavus]UNE47311.1 acetyl-CoA carboxylase biotin carboxyl carrier protein [Aquisalinus flavus]
MTMKTELEWIRALADVLTETGLTEIEIEKNSVKLRVARGGMMVSAAAAPAAPAAAPAATPADVPAPAPANAANHPGAVKSPMVGTAYMSPSPSADPFVAVGSTVKRGQTLMIVEAMKTMNEIKAPKDGTVKEILAQDAEPVEYGEPLMIIE